MFSHLSAHVLQAYRMFQHLDAKIIDIPLGFDLRSEISRNDSHILFRYLREGERLFAGPCDGSSLQIRESAPQRL